MIYETPFLAWWREVCPKLWLGEARAVWALREAPHA